MTRIPSLDGLRTSSVLLVLIGHFAFVAGFRSELTDLYAHAGVRMFFVISGYLITTLMLREIERNGTLSIRGFYVRRAWRILPVAYAYLAVITWIEHAQFSWAHIALSWTYLISFHPQYWQYWDLAHLWSLSVEEQFYLVWPLIVALGLVRTKQMAWAAVLAAPLLRYWYVHHEDGATKLLLDLRVMDSVATGCLFAVYAPKLIGFVSNRRWLGLALPLTLALPALLPLGGQTEWLWPLPQLVSHSVWTIFNLLAGIGILWAITAKPVILNHWVPVWIGTMSYSLYLWQMPFLNPAAPINLWLRLPLAFVCAALSYYAIERPVLALREWTQKRKATLAATALPTPTADSSPGLIAAASPERLHP
jgi:peptidoglycan/LPS O-acetylase OafA/YrhL